MSKQRRRAVNKTLSFQNLTLFITLAFAGVFCQEATPPVRGELSAGLTSPEKVFHFALKHSLDSQDPVESVDVTSGMILSMIHRRLFRTNLDGEVVPDLVERVRRKGARVELVIKQGLLFQNGAPLSSKDVIYCLKRMKDSGRQTWVSENIFRILPFQSPHRVEIELKVPAGADPDQIWQRQKTLFTLTQNSIYSARDHQKEGLFTGASPLYLVKSDLREIVLWAKKPGSQEKEPRFEVRYQVIPDDSARWFAFKRGLLDFYEARGLYRFLGYDEESYELKSRLSLVVLYGAIVAPEKGESVLNSVMFRRALNYRLDRANFAEKVFSGNYSPADYPVPDILGQGVVFKSLYRFTPGWGEEKIKELAVKYPEEEITIFALSDRERGLFSRGIADLIVKMGFRANIKVVDLSTMISLNNRRVPGIYLFMWQADYPHAENFLIPLFHSKNRGSGGNRAYYSNPRLDHILDTKSLEGDTLRRVQEIIRRDAPWIFLGFSRDYIFTRRGSQVKIPVLYTGWGVEALGYSSLLNQVSF